MQFEILTESGYRFRSEDKDVSWQYALKHGSIDELDKTTVEILRHSDDESECILTISHVIAAGEVGGMDLLMMPRERIRAQCPRCGYLEG